MLHIFLRFPSSTWCVFNTQTITGIEDRRFVETSKISSLRAGAVWYGVSMKHQTCHSKPNASGWIEIPVRIPITWKIMEGIFHEFSAFPVLSISCLWSTIAAISAMTFSWLACTWHGNFVPTKPAIHAVSSKTCFHMPVLDDSSHLHPGPWGSHQGKHSTWVLLADLPAQSCASIHASG